MIALQLTAKQAADYARLKSYYPYRMFFLVTDPRQPALDPEIWAMRDKRAINRVLREGGEVLQIS